MVRLLKGYNLSLTYLVEDVLINYIKYSLRFKRYIKVSIT